jgi:hypothetical protein
MKPYLLTTGTLFALIAVLHIWRSIAEWPPQIGAEFFFMQTLTLLCAALAAWAFALLARRKS